MMKRANILMHRVFIGFQTTDTYSESTRNWNILLGYGREWVSYFSIEGVFGKWAINPIYNVNDAKINQIPLK